ncbi:hypothetical protein DYB28_014855 [Aphanomyces astaci]|uniref:Uncharacterized protein n=1 Tax=Aphanomyces astaci TaxID=112090 RepID=A0A9X8H5M1_APHAT|nr:hypothetical protein DYB28_014855 [Aphanomyces astaci]
MAWFSSGTTNDELAMALKGHDIIKSKEVLDAFRQTLNEMLIRLQDSINHGLEIDPGVVDSCRASLTQYANHQRRGSGRDAPPNNQVDDSDDEDGGTSELSDEDMHEVEVPQQGIEGAKKQVDASFSVCHVVCGDVFRMNVAKNMKYDRYVPFRKT